MHTPYSSLLTNMASRTLLQFYYDPPGHLFYAIDQKDRGSPDIEPLVSGGNNTFPERIMQEGNICSALMQFGSGYLVNFPDLPLHSLLDDTRAMTNRALAVAYPGDEVKNADVFTYIFNYMREFVVAADMRDVGYIQPVIPCRCRLCRRRQPAFEQVSPAQR